MVAVLLLGQFLAVAAVVIVTPGQDTALTIRNTFAGGRTGGVRTAAGVACGQCVWALATSAGLAALLVASEGAFLALRIAGAAYLCFLGVQAIHGAWRGERAREPVAPRRRAPFRQGLISNLGNPKMAVFFPSLLPQFAHSFGALLALGLVFAAMTFCWLTLVARAGGLLRASRVKRALDAVVGVVLVALGVRLAADAPS